MTGVVARRVGVAGRACYSRRVARSCLLVAMALWVVWLPVETVPLSAVVGAVVVMVLLPRARARWAAGGMWPLAAAATLVGMAALSTFQGCDRATAFGELTLAAAVIAVATLAAERPPERQLLLAFAIGVIALSGWALWQVAVGLESAEALVGDAPLHLREAVRERLASRRAFASLLLPSHLAVLLATALPLVLGRPGRLLPVALRTAVVLLGAAGLVSTVSPVGLVLAAAACLVVLLAGARWRSLLVVTLVAGVLLAAVCVARPDLADLEPVRLRLDNWRTALWVWSSAPVSGVGLGSFGQVAQGVPFSVGNRPQHAHCLPLEWAAELGVAGAALALMLAWSGLGLVRRLWPAHPEVAVAVAVVPLHNLVDFSLFTSGVALPWAILLGWGVALTRPGGGAPAMSQRAAGPSRRHSLRLVAGAVAVAVATTWAVSVHTVRGAAAESDPRLAFAAARNAHALAPWTVEPLVWATRLALESQDPTLVEAALELVERGRWARPASPLLAACASQLALAIARVPTAVCEAWTAAEQQPSNTLHGDTLRALLADLEAGRRRVPR